MKQIKRKRRNTQSGQGLMEYIIISSLVGIFCLVAVKQFGSVVQKRITAMRESVVKTIPLDS